MVAPIYIPTNSKQGFSFLYILVWQIFWLKAPQREYPLLWKEPLPLLQNHYFKIGPPGWRGRWEGGSGWGIHVTPWLIHVNVWQNPWKCCEVISLQPIKKKKMDLLYGKWLPCIGWNFFRDWGLIPSKASPSYLLTFKPWEISTLSRAEMYF